jgi:hypothetical protein
MKNPLFPYYGGRRGEEVASKTWQSFFEYRGSIFINS